MQLDSTVVLWKDRARILSDLNFDTLVTESSWVDLEELKVYTVLSFPVPHSRLQDWMKNNVVWCREITKHTYLADRVLSWGVMGGRQGLILSHSDRATNAKMSARCWKSRQKEAVETKTQRERDGRVNMTTKSHKPSKTRWGLILHLRFSALPTLVLKQTVCRATDLKNAEINREREKLQISLHISHSECKINSTLLCELLQLFSARCFMLLYVSGQS